MAQANERARFLRQSFGQQLIQQGELSIGVTVSVGIATFPVRADNTRDLMKYADQALE